MKKADRRIVNDGDDLGALWYTFYGYTLAESIEWIRRANFISNYRIVQIEVTRKFWLFGKVTKVFVLLEDGKYLNVS